MDLKSTKPRVRFLALAAGTLAATFGQALVWAAHPPTPSPCAADGTCLPNRETWGYYYTNWRPWPGDDAGITPTPAEAPDAADDEGVEIGGPEAPKPQDETRAGPNIPEREEDVIDEPGEPAEEGGLDGDLDLDTLPAIDPLGMGMPTMLQPGMLQPRKNVGLVQPAAAHVAIGASEATFKPMATKPMATPPAPLGMPADIRVLPQSHSTIAPSEINAREVNPNAATPNEAFPAAAPQQTPGKNLNSDDPPPALPNVLRRVAAISAGATIGSGRNAARLTLRSDDHVRPTAHASAIPVTAPNATAGIRVISPAGGVVADPETGGPQQAIYFEATDVE